VPDATCLVVTGVYGSGKTSVVEELAAIVEERTFAYAALDLDWLWWFDADLNDGDARRNVLMANLAALVDNYQNVGVNRFLMAWAIKDAGDLDALQRAVAMPVRVARLTVPVESIRQRLAASPVAERRRDASIAERWIARGVGSEIGDIEVANTGPIRETAQAIIEWLGWDG
jgi:hypothetical protein